MEASTTSLELGSAQIGTQLGGVSRLALGTVELGVDYGVSSSGVQLRPSRSDAVDLLCSAADLGVTLFDTAPNYGASESLLGEALGKRKNCLFATKVNIPKDNNGRVLGRELLEQTVRDSLRVSSIALRRDVIDLVQIHNATDEVMLHSGLPDILQSEKAAGRILEIGVSVYSEQEAMIAIEDGRYSSVQIPFSVLDQRARDRVFKSAETKGTALLGRSALLKGVLTSRCESLPTHLVDLRKASIRLKEAWRCRSWDELAAKALRYCLYEPHLRSVFVGVSNMVELHQAIACYRQGPLDDADLRASNELEPINEHILNPSHWGIP